MPLSLPMPSRTGTLATLFSCTAALALLGLPARADSGATTPLPSRGTEEVTSIVSEVDACNRAQQQRPTAAVVTGMHYWRVGQPGERAVTCQVRWSTAADAQPTGRPILFGPTY
ncbi:MAG: hypothetical protein K0U63_13000 [Cyanobacteria bacterium]|nr:hypothetical protein [Cyanobacteriota bacterium]